MTTPKSPEQIMEEFKDRTYVLDFDHPCCFNKEKETEWLRSSMASLLCYMAERMKLPCDDEVFYDKDGNSFSNPRTLLIEEARKISNEKI